MTNLNYKPTIWTRADALKVNENDPTTTQPIVSADFPVMSDEVFIWDTMPLRSLDGTVVSVDGWSVIFTLTAQRNNNNSEYLDADGNYDITSDWNNRHGRAKICYWYSRTGKDWIFGGRVMAEGVSPTTREWAGTPILLNEDGEIDLYYTCVTPGATIAKVRGKVLTSEEGVTLAGFNEVKSLFSADGVYYQTESQNHKFTYAEGLTGPDGVYGFLSDRLTGPYSPMNGSGLVLGNPPSQPFQTYSHCVMPNGLVTSFIDNVPTTDGNYRIGGTEAPTVKIVLTVNRSFVERVFDYGYIPPMKNIILN